MHLTVTFEPGRAPVVRLDAPDEFPEEVGQADPEGLEALEAALHRLWPDEDEGAPEPHPAGRLRAELTRWLGDTDAAARRAKDEAKRAVEVAKGVRVTEPSPNPYSNPALRNAWTLGERAGRSGGDLGACPYSAADVRGARRAWYEGHAAGSAQPAPVEGARRDVEAGRG